METLTSAINVQVDKQDKEQATNILKDLGLNMSTAINMFVKQIIKEDGIPFEIKNPKPSKELLEALREGEQIIQDLESGKRKGYNNIDKLFEDLENGL